MAKDRNNQPIKQGDTVGVLFKVIESVDNDGTGTNVVLQASHVPEGEHAAKIHLNSGAVTLVNADDVPPILPLKKDEAGENGPGKAA
jgi:hypothetical protein